MNDVSIKPDDALDRLAVAAGILPEYFDIAGERHGTPGAAQRALLAAMGTMGTDAVTDADAAAALAAQEEREWKHVLPPVAVLAASNVPFSVDINLPQDLATELMHWRLTPETGEPWSGESIPARLPKIRERHIDGVTIVRHRFVLSQTHVTLGLGYHRFELEVAGRRAAMTLIVAPDRCYEPEALGDEGRLWGFAVQLYGLRSRRNWGIGDLTDLKRVVEFAGENGASIVALNPLHALSSTSLQHASPYAPSSRLFGNPLYIDVEAIPEYADCWPAMREVSNPAFQDKLRWLRTGELVGYRVSATVKRQVLELLFRHFRDVERTADSERSRAFAAYLKDGGEALHRHALYEAIAESLHASGAAAAGDWRQWPVALQDANGATVAAFASANAERVEFHAWLQWQFDRQLDVASARAAELGLGLGIARDLAVGFDPGGSESWSNPSLYASNVSVGAPPDSYNTMGQNWGLPPMIPARLRDTAYAPFITMLRRNMRAAGALRIDHVMGLLRLYWIPAGTPADAGAYVHYPFDDLLAILALESHRNRCVVIGEDLGTVPDEVRAGLDRVGVLSTRPLYFAHDGDGEFAAPTAFPRDAVISVGTHDLATFKGFWVGADLDAREALQSVPQPGQRYALNVERTGARRRLLHALEREGLLPQGIDPYHIAHGEWSPELGIAVQRYLARSPARILLIAIEDLFAQRDQVNLPGTLDELPNWRRKAAHNLEDWQNDPAVRALIDAIKAER